MKNKEHKLRFTKYPAGMGREAIKKVSVSRTHYTPIKYMDTPVCGILYWSKGTSDVGKITCPDCLKWLQENQNENNR